MLALALLLFTPLQTASNIHAKELVSSAIAIMGGDHYLQASERSGNGRVYTFTSTGDLATPGDVFWSYYRFPSDERVELTKHHSVVYIYSADRGWEITYKGVAPMLRKQLTAYQDANRHSLDVILKTWASNPQTLMLYQGLSSIDQAQVESVAFTTADGDNAVVDFSITTHLPLRVHWRREDPDTGGHFEESVIYGNWVRIGAIYTPFALDHFEGTQRVDQRFYTNVSFAPFADSMFQPTPLGKKH